MLNSSKYENKVNLCIFITLLIGALVYYPTNIKKNENVNA